MANPQLNELVDYIKKASLAGQPDDQTRQVLYKNGWSEAEVNDAFVSISANKPQQQTQPQTQQQQIMSQPRVQSQPQPQVQSQVQAQPTVAKNFKTEGKRHSVAKLIFALIVVLILIAAIGAGVVLATRIWDPAWSPFRPSPESVIIKAWDNLKLINSGNFNTEFLVNGKGMGTPESTFDFDITAKANGGADIGKKIASMKADISAVQTDSAGNKLECAIAGEGRIVNEIFYLKIDKLDIGDLAFFLEMFGIDVNKIKGQWIKFDEQGAQDDLLQYIGVETSQQLQDQKYIKESLDRIVKILLDRKAYDVKQLPDNQDSEGKEYHYSVSLNRQKFNDALPEIYAIIEEYSRKIAEDAGEIYTPEFTFEQTKEQINDSLDKIGDVSIELFISKTDSFFHKVQVVKNDLNLSKLEKGSVGVLQMNYKIEQSGINQPVQVEAPLDAKSLQEILDGIVAPAPTAKNPKVKSDLDRLSEIANLYFGSSNSYISFCKSGYLNGYLTTYGAEITKLSKDMVAQGTGWANCFSSARSYCVSVQLADKSWMCAAKTGAEGTTKCISATTLCE